MTENVHTRLHRLHDDDLSAEEKAELEKELAADPELGKKLEGLREVGAVVRAARTDEAPIDSDILWAAIEGKIAAPVETKPALRIVEGGAIEGGAPKTAPAAEDPRTRRRRIIGIAVGAFAIAAAALLMIYGPPSSPPDTMAETGLPETGLPETGLPEVTTPEETAPGETVAATDYTEVLAVDFGTNVGTIFAVEGEGGQRYAVVWLDDVLKRDEGDVPPEEQTPN